MVSLLDGMENGTEVFRNVNEQERFPHEPDLGEGQPGRSDAESRQALELARKRTHMASERTDLALIRTGFTTASFGAGLTQLIGRGVWPGFAVDLMIILFIVAGFVSVQIGLSRLRLILKSPEGIEDFDLRLRRLLVFGVYLLQVALVAMILMVVIHM